MRFRAMLLKALIDESCLSLREPIHDAGPNGRELVDAAANHPRELCWIIRQRAALPGLEEQVGIGSSLGERHVPGRGDVIAHEERQHRETVTRGHDRPQAPESRSRWDPAT